MSESTAPGVLYDTPRKSHVELESAYFEKRELKRVAGAWKLWALGVAAVISGEFSGWNFGLGVAGFWGLAIATVIITTMYLLLCYSLAEMSPALPHTGGAYSFARTTMGPWGGFVTGLAENMEYVFTPAVIVYFATQYLKGVFEGTPIGNIPEPVGWAILYAVFITLNSFGAQLSFRFSLLIAGIAMAILTLFCLFAIPHMIYAHAMDIKPEEGMTKFLPFGTVGILKALPFAVWFYLGIEELPLAAEETISPERDMPKGIMFGIGTLIIFALATLVCNSSLAPGAAALSTSGEPVLEGFRTIFGAESKFMGIPVAKIFGLFATAGLIASFHGIMFAYGRQIYSLSRAGYFPRFMSLTHGTSKAPYMALIVGGVIGYAVMIVLYYASGDATTYIGTKLLCVAVFGAMISYCMQMLSYVILKLRFPTMPRPYKSPFGLAGAIIAGVIAFVTLITLFIVDPANYRSAAIGAGLWFFVGLLYFIVYSRHHLVLSPEESFAMKLLDKQPDAPVAAI